MFPTAFITLKPGLQPSHDVAREIFKFIRGRLAPYKRIRRIEFSNCPKPSRARFGALRSRCPHPRKERKDGAALSRGSLRRKGRATRGFEQLLTCLHLSLLLTMSG